MEHIITALCAALGGGLLVFVQFLITRHDNKKGYIAELGEKIDSLFKKFDDFTIVSLRRHIFDFQREVRRGVRHTHEEWNQCLEDISDYERYCKAHEDFKNNRCDMAIDFLKTKYRDILMTNDFDE